MFCSPDRFFDVLRFSHARSKICQVRSAAQIVDPGDQESIYRARIQAPRSQIQGPATARGRRRFARCGCGRQEKARPPAQSSRAEEPAAAKTGAKRGRKPKAAADAPCDDMDMSDIEADLVGEPEATTTATGEKVKPLRMKISKAKERALMKEFGLDETVLSEEDMAKRRAAPQGPDHAGQDPRLPDPRRNLRPLARQAGRCRNAGSRDLHVERHGRGRLRADPGRRNPAAEQQRVHCRHRGRSRRRSRSRSVHGGQRIRPHHRPRAHVHARNGHGRAADPRRRN